MQSVWHLGSTQHLSASAVAVATMTAVIVVFIPLAPGAGKMLEKAPSWTPAARLIFKQDTLVGISCLEIRLLCRMPRVSRTDGEMFIVATQVGKGFGGSTRERVPQDVKMQARRSLRGSC